ncbi:MAG: hypothetical protein GY721_14090, partial [Deltaproteobacteria bacterium]|nr:hypothetical protein [Deltaproteobacteria bacterium]
MILILDIEKHNVRAGIFSAKTMEPNGSFSHPIGPIETSGEQERGEAISEAISAILAEMEEKGFTRFQRILAGIPSGDLTLRVLPIPFEEREKIMEVLPFEVAPLLPRGTEEMVIDGIHLGNGPGEVSGEGKVLAVAVEKSLVGEYLDILRGCGLDPFWLGSALFSLDTLLMEKAGDATVGLTREDSIAVVSSGRHFFFKHLSGLDDLKLSAFYLD